jgi:DNA-binding transcriptional regulator YiaG
MTTDFETLGARREREENFRESDATMPRRARITSAQIRAARALVNLSARQLSLQSGVSPSTVHRAETAVGTPNIHRSSLAAIKATLEAFGVEFLDDSGVRLK